MVLGITFSLLGIGALVAFMFNMAILALPLFAAVAAGRFAYDIWAGALGAIAVGCAAGAAALGMGQAILLMTRSTLVRLAVALAITAPAAFAGYHLVLGLSRCCHRLGRCRRPASRSAWRQRQRVSRLQARYSELWGQNSGG